LDSAEKIAAVMDAAGELDSEAREDRGTYRRPVIATLVLAGPRISEADHLRWRDVDLAGGTLTIDRSKTQAGERTVNLLPLLRDELATHKAASTFTGPDDPVFATRQGKRIGKDNLRNRVFAAAVDRANANLTQAGRQPLPVGLTPHDLRRTFVSVLFALGEDLPYVMDQVGHADSRMTTGIYMKVMRRDEGHKDALRALVDGGVWDAMGREPVSGHPTRPL
jgi:integrase